MQPASAELLGELGEAYRAAQRFEDAARCFERAIALRPDYADAYNNLGVLAMQAGRVAEAVELFRRAVSANPGLVHAHSNLGVALQELGRAGDAESCFRRALSIKPHYAEGHFNLGNALAQLGRLDEALGSYGRALELRPHYVEALVNLGAALQALHRAQEAERCYLAALALDPSRAEAHNNLGNVFAQSARRAQALAAYREALRLRPGYAEAQINFVHQCQHLCAWRDAAPVARAVRERVARQLPGRVSPFSFLAMPGTDASEHFECARQFAASAYASYFSRGALCTRRAPRERARLRLGYLSGDFFEHPASHLLAEVIELHERSRFEVLGYSCGPNDGSAIRLRLERGVDGFRDLRALSHEAAAARILDDEVDILVDLSGHTSHGRLEILAQRPAPVQASWLGYPGSLGDRRLADYIIGDPIVTPREHAGRYSEWLALMPHCYQPNDRKRRIDPAPTRAAAGLPEQAFVFCCFNQSYKITAEMLDVWCELLRRILDSVLWLAQPDPAARENLVAEAGARGIAATRLVFASRPAYAQHLGRLQLADLALDTFPFVSHATASDLMWAGVPLLTRIGETYISRAAASICTAAGLPDMVAASLDEYRSLALELATRREKLREVRSRLAANRDACPLFDSKRFTRDLERLFEKMWQHRSVGERYLVLEAT